MEASQIASLRRSERNGSTGNDPSAASLHRSGLNGSTGNDPSPAFASPLRFVGRLDRRHAAGDWEAVKGIVAREHPGSAGNLPPGGLAVANGVATDAVSPERKREYAAKAKREHLSTLMRQVSE